jgi:hypothetical protein
MGAGNLFKEEDMEPQKCPIINNKCYETECAWFITSIENIGQKGPTGCAVKMLALAKLTTQKDAQK